MSQAIVGRPAIEEVKGEIQELGKSKLVVEHVEVKRVREVIRVPEIVIEKVPTTLYVPQEEKTIKYEVETRPTVNYVAQEQQTIKYIPKEEATIKYVVNEVSCEKPVLTDVPYERPVIREKEYTVVTLKDLEAIRELIKLAPVLLDELNKLKKYNLVEETIRVQQVQYDPVKVERIVWQDKARCSKCGDLVNG